MSLQKTRDHVTIKIQNKACTKETEKAVIFVGAKTYIGSAKRDW